jgi:hypothetical protein
MLAAIAIGLLAGVALGGRPERLGELSFRWLPLAVAGLLVQVCLFSTPLGDLAGPLGPPLYVASTAAVLVVVLRNVAIPILAVVALGSAANLAAVVANGGYMPADPSAAASLGQTAGSYSNSAIVTDPALRPLTDIWATPAWMPFANVFSVGDVLIAIGVAVTIALAMRRRPVEGARDVPTDAPTNSAELRPSPEPLPGPPARS